MWHVRSCRTRTSGAQRRLWWRKGVSTFQQKFWPSDTSTGHFCTVCGTYLFSTTPCVHRPPTFSCLPASNTLTCAAFSLPLSCFGLSTRNDVSRLCSRGDMAPRCFTIKLLCAAMASHTPWSDRTHQAPFAAVSPRLLLYGSLSHSLPLPLSCPLSCPLSRSTSLRSFPIAPHSLSLSLLSVPLPLCPTLSLSLSRFKGVFGTFGGSLSPPGFEPSSTGQKRCGISTGLRRVVICITCSNMSYSPLRVIPCHAYLLSHGGVLSSV